MNHDRIRKPKSHAPAARIPARDGGPLDGATPESASAAPADGLAYQFDAISIMGETADQAALAEMTTAARRTPGRPVPERLRTKFEGALSSDLSGVRLHADEHASAAAEALGARAFTVGQDVFFSAGSLSPDSAAGEHLLAHEVAHTVQQREGGWQGSSDPTAVRAEGRVEAEAHAAAAAMTAGWPIALPTGNPPAAAPVLRQPVDFPFEATNKPRDMVEIDWTVGPPVDFPTNPQPLVISVGYEPPIPRSPQPAIPDLSTATPPGHQPAPSFFDFNGMLIQEERKRAWAAWGVVVADVNDTWIDVSSHVKLFNDTKADPALKDIEGIAGGSNDENLHQLANEQKVGGQGPKQAGATSIGDLFQNQTLLNGKLKVSVGTDVELDANTQKGLAQAAGKVDTQKAAVKLAEDKIGEALPTVQQAVKLVSEKVASRNAARDGIKLEEAKEKGDQNQEALTRLQEQKAADTKAAQDLGKVLELFSKAAEQGPGAAAIGLAEFTVEQLIDASYEERIKAAKAQLEQSKREISKIAKDQARDNFIAAHEAFIGSLIGLETARAGLKTALDARKEAYRQLAESAGRASGGDRATQNRIRAVLEAIPVVERIVDRIQEIQKSFFIPAYSRDSGVGFDMAMNAYLNETGKFAQAISMLKGGKAEFDDRLKHWTARLASLRKVYDEL
jgi:hypothetical protein